MANIMAKFSEGAQSLVNLDQVFPEVTSLSHFYSRGARQEQLRQWRLSVETDIKEIPAFLS